jgi:hypothetical protein
MTNSLPEILQRRDREHDANACVVALIYIKSALTALKWRKNSSTKSAFDPTRTYAIWL